MGRQPRGLSSHRRGCVTRACIQTLLQPKRVGMQEGVVDCIVRWGGWQAVTGNITVLRVDAYKVIDQYLAVFGLAYGCASSC